MSYDWEGTKEESEAKTDNFKEEEKAEAENEGEAEVAEKGDMDTKNGATAGEDGTTAEYGATDAKNGALTSLVTAPYRKGTLVHSLRTIE